MQQLLEIMPDMAIIFGQDKRILDIINPDDTLLMGVKPENLVSRHV